MGFLALLGFLALGAAFLAGAWALTVVHQNAWWFVLAWATLPVLVGWCHRAPRRPADPLADPRRHVAALCATFPALAKKQEADGTPVWVRPQLRVDEQTGDRWVTYALPRPGPTAQEVAAKRGTFLHNLGITGVPTERWFVEEAGEVGRVRVGIRAPRPDLTPRAPVLPERTSWRDPVVIGRDKTSGRDVAVPTFDVPLYLITGASGSRKTTTVGQRVVAHFALDPTVTLWGFDGKGSRLDWQGMVPRFERWHWGTDPDSPAKALQLLRDLEAECQRRITQLDPRDATRGTLPGMVVVLEEYTVMRGLLTGKDLQAFDRILKGVAVSCRAANVLLVLTAQRPVAEDVKGTIRAQAGVVICLRMDRAADGMVVFGDQDSPVDQTPVGDAIVKTLDRHGRVNVRLDSMYGGPWKALCASLSPVGARPAPGPQKAAQTPQDAPASPPQGGNDFHPETTVNRATGEVLDEPRAAPPLLLLAAGAVVNAAAERRLDATTLHAFLPDEVRPATVRAMGNVLNAAGWEARPDEHVIRADGSRSKARYRYADDYAAVLAKYGTRAPDEPVFHPGWEHNGNTAGTQPR